jgi:transcriptional regulator with XRE-family HTH domain
MTGSDEATQTGSLRERREYLREFRKQLGYSLQEIAKLSDLSKSMLSKFELGHRDLSAEAWGRLENALDAKTAAETAKLIAPEDPDYQTYKDFLKGCALKFRKIVRGIIKTPKRDLERRVLTVELLKRLSESNPKNAILKEWFEAERTALLAFKKIRNFDARFDLEVGIRFMEKAMGRPVGEQQKIVNGLEGLGLLSRDMAKTTLDVLEAGGKTRKSKSNG